MGTVLRIGDVEGHAEEACEILVKTSKATAVARGKSWKKFARRVDVSGEDDKMEGDGDDGKKVAFAQLMMRTEYYIDQMDHSEDKDEEQDDAMDVDEDTDKKASNLEKVQKEQLVRGFKYGSTYAPCPDGQFPKLATKKGIDICGFFLAENVCPPFCYFTQSINISTVPPGTPYG